MRVLALASLCVEISECTRLISLDLLFKSEERAVEAEAFDRKGKTTVLGRGFTRKAII